MSKKLDDHYTAMGIEPIMYSYKNNLDPYQHTIVKYVTRYQAKGGIRDLKAAQLLLGKYIDELESSSPKESTPGPIMNANLSAPEAMTNLLNQLKEAEVQKGLDHLIIIPRGGFTVAHVIAEHLEIPASKIRVYDPTLKYEGNCLVIEDIVDSGASMEAIIKNNSFIDTVVLASLYQRVGSIVRPEFVGSVITHNEYVVMPWEDPDANKSQ